MIIINADDLGRSREETDAALACHRQRRITSASAMVFMEDSERAAGLAMEQGLDIGLHLNLDEHYNGRAPSAAASLAHHRVVRFLSFTKFARLVFQPFLRRSFREVVHSQIEEFGRLYGDTLSHIDGHHHQHLCANIVLDELLPKGAKVRRNLSIEPGEKSILNRYYRVWIDRRLALRHQLTDYLFTLQDGLSRGRLGHIAKLARTKNVELETHPVIAEEYQWLMSDDFLALTRNLQTRPYALL